MNTKRRITYITSGAAGMYCGSCMHDNTLVRAMQHSGWDIQLVPTYTPIRTDEDNVSVDQVFFGGLNVYLQQKIPLLRHVPPLLDRLLDNPRLIRRVTSRALETNPQELGKLTVSMLQGLEGRQRKEVRRLVNWLELSARPDLVMLSNILIGGAISQIKQRLGIPVLVTLQGDDVFLDHLPQPFRQQALQLASQIAAEVDGFVVHSRFYRDYMARYLRIDVRRIHVTPLGIDTADFASLGEQRNELPARIGYLARLAPEKGLDILVDAFIRLKKQSAANDAQLWIAGWLGPDNRAYAQTQFDKLHGAGLSGDYRYLGVVDRAQKLDFLRSIDLLSVPTMFLEPKGLYVLEALAAGVPVVQPDHGAFGELIQDTGGGKLVPPNDPDALCAELAALLSDRRARQLLAEQGRQAVLRRRSATAMAQSTGEVFRRYLQPKPPRS